MPETATPTQVFAGLVVLTLFLASPVMFVWLVVRRVRGETIVPFEHRRRPVFGLIELGLASLLFLGLNFLAYYVINEVWALPMGDDIASISPDQFLLLILANTLTFVVTCVALLLMLPLRGGKLADYGITLRRASSDIALGVGAFLLMGGFVYGLQSILFQLFPQQHPLLELIQANPEPKYFLGAFFSAGIMAPLYEEFLFRGALQGWLEKLMLPDRQGVAAATEIDPPHAEMIVATPATSTEGSVETDNPYASPHAKAEAEASDEPLPEIATASDRRSIMFSWLPIVISSLIFASVHLGQGPAPIPLFFLALCLGFLYQRTHRLLPCITLHACLNLTSIVMLWMSVG